MVRMVWFFMAVFSAVGSRALAESEREVTPSRQFLTWDKNEDKKLSRSELPAPMRRNFDRVDLDQDGSISPAEDLAFRESLRSSPTNGAVRGKVCRVPDVAYVVDGHERQVLDLYLPEATTDPVPLVVYIHGGGWKQGDKSRTPLKVLLDAGFAGASINYRLSGHATFPAQIHDCKAAIRWLRAHATTYGYDGDRIGVWGSSAGGHLVALLGTSGDVDALEGTPGDTGVSSRVQAVCDYFGPTDLLKMDEQAGSAGAIRHNAANSPEALLLGGPIQERRQLARSANPITYVSADDPPFYIVHGDEDRLVSLGQSELLKDALDAAGVRNDLRVVRGAGHGQFRDPEVIASVLAFFQRELDFDPDE